MPTTGLAFAGLGGLGEALIRELPKFPAPHLAAVQDGRAAPIDLRVYELLDRAYGRT